MAGSASVPAHAQEVISSVTIRTSVPGVRYRVDGQEYRGPVAFLWPKGSKHLLEAYAVSYNDQRNIKYTFTGWKDDKGMLAVGSSPMMSVVADPNVTSYEAGITVEYEVQLIFFNAGGSATPVGQLADPCTSVGTALYPPPPLGPLVVPPGAVWIGGTCYNQSTTFFTPGGPATLNAIPGPGFVFTGWGLNQGPPDSAMRSVEVRGPMSIVAYFAPAKRVRFVTDPPDMNVMVDRTVVPTLSPFTNILPYPLPGAFDFALGSTHELTAPSPQIDLSGRSWVFDAWDFAPGQIVTYKVDNSTTPVTLTARFVPGATVTFLTNPPGLKLTVDGRENYASHNFVWGVGHKHKVLAPAETTDSKGRRYTFKGWSNGGPAEQEITVPPEAERNGIRLTASYELMPRLTVAASQPGVRLSVDGADCALPCVLDRARDAVVTLSVPATISMGAGTRLDFDGWSDGPEAARTFRFSADEVRLSFRYRTMHRLVTLAEPPEGVEIKVSPASPDGFYAEGAQVLVEADARPGFRFRRWEGDLNTTYRAGTLAMTTPRQIRALLDKITYIAPAGVRNAAGETPESGVAAGSIISIFGANLALAYEAGAASPLAQTIGGVTVRLGTRLLPLLFVSPEQINAQLPSDIPEGDQVLYVRVGMQPEVGAKFQVVRNAPGLFSSRLDQNAFLVAVHEDGTPVTPDSPALRGETVTLFGTGFGPLERPAPDGFAVPAAPAFALADKVEIVLGEASLEAKWAGAAPGMVGMMIARFQVGEELPSASLDAKVRVNGRESNAALLPVK